MKISEIDGSQGSDSVGSKVNWTENAEKGQKVGSELEQKLESELKEAEENAKKKEPTKQDVKEGTDKLNQAIKAFHEELKFEFHEESDRMITKIINTKNHEVIKEIPPKELLEMLGKIRKMVGLFVDEKI